MVFFKSAAAPLKKPFFAVRHRGSATSLKLFFFEEK